MTEAPKPADSDHSITAPESAELNEVGKELGFRADEVDTIRVEFSDQLASLQAMRRMTTPSAEG